MKIELAEVLNTIAKDVHKTNVDNGFWDLPEKVAKLCTETKGSPIDRESSEFIESAIFNQSLLLISSEISECCEAVRIGKYAELEEFKEFIEKNKVLEMKKDLKDVIFSKVFEEKIKDSIEDELADALIRILDLSAGCGIDIGKHVLYKLNYNQTRSKKHGKKF